MTGKQWVPSLIGMFEELIGFAYSMKKTNAVLFSLLIIVASLAGCLGEDLDDGEQEVFVCSEMEYVHPLTTWQFVYHNVKCNRIFIVYPYS